jgi:hypothetical protein
MTRTTPSLKALSEIKEALVAQLKNKYSANSSYNWTEYVFFANTPTHEELAQAKHALIEKVSSEVESYVVRNYGKYGIISVPICHRSSSEGHDRLEIDLKMKEFPGTKSLQDKVNQIDAQFKADMKSIDSWYFSALRAVAAKDSLPEPPNFTKDK